ncbi:haloacid dehalogenase-like hydrolase [Hirsutella rhossiliensis]|uniref:Haloacid dehalogenase-like hydrolase domain-containing protein n=1 Tax=Hirsutella rhossiliensis TaxID=111463 RepID=A0A9P8N4L4_9HYPO|nr:haloacid dehalogenase-like hydrolase domain-containing protein [Hirsutella rhossiliensis]KAH0966517.1 haloacid dehalogenase-like hydrolase domain-containing protein [Hirsutella rhossiliensis]
MGSVSSDTPALATKPAFIFFTDFDGTVTTADSNDFMTDNLGFGRDRRVQGNKGTLDGRVHFRDSFREMMDSVATPFDECLALLLRSIELDPGFKDFYAWARASNVPIVILSGGMEPVIRALLDKLLGPGWDIQIVSNDVCPRDGRSINDVNGWTIQYHDDSVFGHDKSIEIRKYSSRPDRPILFYAGDGVSDLSAAKETDLLFAKADKDLVTYCERENVPFVTFRDWTSITQTCKDIAAGKISVQDAAKGRI